MTRTRVLGLVVVLAALVGALAVGFYDRPSTAQKADDLAPLRAQVALPSCPAGIGPDLPAVTLPCLGGGAPVALNGTPSGVPTLVNVYGSWCGPCQKEMPLLVAFSKVSAGKVGLVGVDTEDAQRDGLLFAKDVHQTWPAFVDDDKVVLRRFASGAPATLFVTPAGKVVHVKLGAFKDLTELKALVSRYLGVNL
jgi:thiol-disulfide isomerase/thioredoxin